ncbi:MAG: hypothetical protein K6A65_09270 [Succinivibrionaceae bacterium]|nr:hypothetical protein [Succinivibrionaceae bacterium]
MSTEKSRGNLRNGRFDPQSYRRLLGPRYWLSWLSLLLLVILAYVPNRVRDLLALLLGSLLSLLPIPPRRIAYANLRCAFSDISPKECRRIYRRATSLVLSIMFSYAEPSVLPISWLKRRWIVHGKEHLERAISSGRPIIFVAPHCIAIDRCGLYLSYLGLPMCTMMHSQRNPVYDWFLNRQRQLGATVYERSAGLRAILRELKAGHHCFFLPDEDLGRGAAASSRFVPFFGIPKATVSSLPRLAKMGNALCIQFFSSYSFSSASFEIHFSEPFDPYPTDDLDADLLTMNGFIERELRRMPEQYMWFLRFYQTVPDDTYPDIYANRRLSFLRRSKSIDYAARRRPWAGDPRVSHPAPAGEGDDGKPGTAGQD